MRPILSSFLKVVSILSMDETNFQQLVYELCLYYLWMELLFGDFGITVSFLWFYGNISLVYKTIDTIDWFMYAIIRRSVKLQFWTELILNNIFVLYITGVNLPPLSETSCINIFWKSFTTTYLKWTLSNVFKWVLLEFRKRHSFNLCNL